MFTDWRDWSFQEKCWMWVTMYIAHHEGCHISHILLFFKGHEKLHGEFVLATIEELEAAGLIVSDISGYYYLG